MRRVLYRKVSALPASAECMPGLEKVPHAAICLNLTGMLSDARGGHCFPRVFNEKTGCAVKASVMSTPEACRNSKSFRRAMNSKKIHQGGEVMWLALGTG